MSEQSFVQISAVRGASSEAPPMKLVLIEKDGSQQTDIIAPGHISKVILDAGDNVNVAYRDGTITVTVL